MNVTRLKGVLLRFLRSELSAQLVEAVWRWAHDDISLPGQNPAHDISAHIRQAHIAAL